MATVKQVTEDDWRDLRLVRLSALAHSPSAFASSLEEEERSSEADWREWAGSGSVFIALVQGSPVGMVAALDGDSREERRLVALWVSPVHRACGVASALMSQVERLGTPARCKKTHPMGGPQQSGCTAPLPGYVALTTQGRSGHCPAAPGSRLGADAARPVLRSTPSRSTCCQGLRHPQPRAHHHSPSTHPYCRSPPEPAAAATPSSTSRAPSRSSTTAPGVACCGDLTATPHQPVRPFMLCCQHLRANAEAPDRGRRLPTCKRVSRGSDCPRRVLVRQRPDRRR